MSESEVKRHCNGLLPRRKGYSIEIDDFQVNESITSFKVRILKNGAFRAEEPMTLSSGTHIGNQIDSRVRNFIASVENKLI
jgi:hypothetical protein